MGNAITPTVSLITALLVGYLSYRWGVAAQITISDHQKRQQVFSQLMGRKFVTTQLYVSRFEAFIFSDYHEIQWKLAGHLKESIDLQEAQRWMHKSEDLALELARNNQGLFETIGLIRILFPSTLKLDDLIERIYRFRTPKITRSEQMNVAQPELWKIKAVEQLQQQVENEYAKPIDDLLNYLAAEIAKKSKAKGFVSSFSKIIFRKIA